MSDYQKPIKVTVSDPETGELLQERIVANDYVLVTAGNRYVKSLQVMGRTHMIAVAVAAAFGTRARAPFPHQIPDWEDLRGRAPGATGEKSSEAFVRGLRDAWE